MNITEFLEARIVEDEALARAAESTCSGDRSDGRSDPIGPDWEAADGLIIGGTNSEGYRIPLWDCEGSATLCMSPDAATHAARHDPARVLAECAAKRAIISLAKKAGEIEKEYDDHEWQGTVESSEPLTGDAILYALAAVYKDHPDYQPEWA